MAAITISRRKKTSVVITETQPDAPGGLHGGTEYKFQSQFIRREGPLLLVRSNTVTKKAKLALNEVLLPPTPVHQSVTRLSDHPSLVQGISKVLDRYILNNGDSKSLPTRISAVFAIASKIVEAAWIRGFYRIEDWTQNLFDEIKGQYGEGAWLMLLAVEDRLNKREFPSPRPAANTKQALRRIGCNLQAVKNGSMVAEGDRYVVEALPPSESVFRDFLNINNLIAESLQLGFRPILNVSNDAKNAGRPGGRATNIHADELAIFCADSLRFMERVQAPLLSTFEDVANWAARVRGTPAYEDWELVVSGTKGFKELEKYFSTKVVIRNGHHEENLVFHSIIHAAHDTALHLLAFCNARRKDEICHKDLGLFSNNAQVRDVGLELFTIDFYIEKTLRTRVRYYVNKLSYEIFEFLSKLSGLAAKIRAFRAAGKSDEVTNIFEFPEFRMADFDPRHHAPNKAARRVHPALSAVAPVLSKNFESRSMRRAYALLYYYRFVNGTLGALTQQLAHDSQLRVITYVTDAPNTEQAVHELYGRKQRDVEKFIELDGQELQNEMAIVAHERFEELAIKVMRGEPVLSGGMDKLLRRFHMQLSSFVAYSELDEQRKADVLVSAMEKRGHYVYPLKNGDCWRGNSDSLLRSPCQDEGSLRPNRSKASDEVCNGCPFQSSYHQHTLNMQDECDAMEDDLRFMPAGSLDRGRVERALAAGRRVIMLRQARADRQSGARA